LTTIELLNELRSRRVAIWLDGEELRYRAAPGALTDSLLSEMRVHKPDLVAFLRATEAGTARNELIPPVPRGRPFPLSFAQERLLFLEELAPGTAAYNIAAAVPLSFRVDVGALQQSLGFLVARHESLRTTFTTVDAEPVQVISDNSRLPVNVIDLGHLEPRVRTIEAQRLAREEAAVPFDLRRGPLLRATIIQLGSSQSLLLLTMHHIVSDGWSMGIFYRELGIAYGAFAMGRRPQLPAMRIQYADFAVWQRNWLVGEVLRNELAFWRGTLADAPTLRLPTDRPRPPFQTFNGAARDLHLPSRLSASLQALARREGCTLFMVLLAGYATVLARHSAQRDIVIGTYNAGRNRTDTEHLIGFFINTLALRVRIDPSMTFLDLLRHVRDVTLAAFEHQDLPFPKLIEELDLQRDLSRNPLFQTVFHLFNAPTFPQPDSTPVQEYRHPTESASFDLVMNLMEGPDGLFGQLEYNTDLFDASTVERLVAHFSRVLEQAAAAPGRRILAMTLLSDQERDAILAMGRGPLVPLDEATTLVKLFEARVRDSNDAVAFSTLLGDRLSYRELHSRARRLAARLKQLRLPAEAPVGVYLEPSLELPVALMAVLIAGAVYLPLDRAAPAARLKLIVDDAAPAAVITDRSGASALGLSVDQTLVIDDPVEPPTENGFSGTGVLPTSRAYILYTSGSTGKPKGVEVEHRQVLNRLQWMWRCYPFGADERSCLKTSVGFVDSLWELLGPLLAGSPTVIMPADIVKDPDALVDALSQEGITRIWLVPSLLRALLDGHPDLQDRLPLLRFWVTSGEELSGELAWRFLTQMPDSLLHNLYGTSEVWDASWGLIDSIDDEHAPVSIGRPIDNVAAYVLDEDMGLVPTGVTGELHVGGMGLARGYLGQPELTVAAFVPNPFDGTGRLYRTGDLARWRTGGQLEFIGRRDHQVQVRGLRVELGEVESLLREHPSVADAAVVASKHGSDETRLVGYLSLTTEALDDDSSEFVTDHLRNWQEIWDETYRPVASDGVDGSGFISSFTGEPLAAEDIDQWIENAVAQIVARPHRRVLEIGCGNGALIRRIAPECDTYVATDISATAVEQLAVELAQGVAALASVTLHHRPAHEFRDLPTEFFDVTVLHSVVQYFPLVEYLERVLAGAIGCTADGGVVLIGDVPCLGLLEDFRRATEHFKAPAAAEDEIEQRVQAQIMNEKELWLHPQFFESLSGVHERVTAVEIRPKRGELLNEFTRYRYDVTLRIGAVDRVPAEQIAWAEIGSIPNLRDFLREARREVAVVGIPNARLTPTQGRSDAFDPGTSERFAAEIGRSIDIRWSTRGRPGELDILLRADPVANAPNETASRPPVARSARPARRLGNNPLRLLRAQAFVPTLRQFLSERVPEQMVPGQIVVMPGLPLTSSGKVDRIALSTLQVSTPRRVHAPAQTAAEQVACAIWSDVLGIDTVGVQDDFFTDLGGHSLLGVQAVSRLRDVWRASIPLRLLFEWPTVSGLLSKLCEEPRVRRVVERTSELYLEVIQLSPAQVSERLSGNGQMGAQIVSVNQHKG
jgi:amino acid adenylation domain-containing protein